MAWTRGLSMVNAESKKSNSRTPWSRIAPSISSTTAAGERGRNGRLPCSQKMQRKGQPRLVMIGAKLR